MKPLSDNELQIAAFEYCLLMDQDPEENVMTSPGPSPSGITYDVAVLVPRWKLAMETLRDYDCAMVALEYRRQQQEAE